MSKPVKTGIRQLVEFCCRSGDLSYETGPTVSAQEGLRTHQKIQQRYQQQATSEYRLNLEFNINSYLLKLGGRIDLLFEKENPPRVEEIKTIYSFMNSSSSSYEEPHWAQVKCYAACYAIQQDIQQVTLSLNYVDIFNHQEHRQTKTLDREELESFLQHILEQYINWYQLIEQQNLQTITTAGKLQFPHQKFRQHQHYFASQVYRNIKNKGQLMIEAPTGSGKTISTLFPAIKAIGEGHIDQIVYLSAKTSGQNQAISAIQMMNQQGLNISYLVIQAKAKACVCNHQETEVNEAGKCIRTLGFFDRLAEARETLVKNRHLNTETIQKVAEDYQLCPFELSLQMLPWVDIIIGDFNYVFDPLVQLSYFKTDNKSRLLLIDELHNLIDRARDMHSIRITRKQIKSTSSNENNHKLKSVTNSLKRALDKHFSTQSEDEIISNETSQSFYQATLRFNEKLNIDLFSNKHVSTETLELAKNIFRYQCIHNLYSDHHKTISIKPLKKRQIKLLCLNAFEYLKKTYPLFDSICGFSATLTPAEYFLQALGFDQSAQILRLQSSFPVQNLQVNICDYIDTRYQQRESYIEQICNTIHRCYLTKPGNYLVFFSSYYFMNLVYDHFQKHFGTISTLIQTRESTDRQRQDFLNHFFEQNNRLGFAIMGGIFAEGIDYQGQSLIGSILVGVGLPQANTEQQLIENDFIKIGLNGFNHAYRFPGLIRIQQSAGRVIRSETDRGVIVLLDRRFNQMAYRQYFPAHWQTQLCQDINALENSLKEFWSQEI